MLTSITFRTTRLHIHRVSAIQRTLNLSHSAMLQTATSPMASEATTFGSLQGRLDPRLLHALQAMKYEYMSPVQAKVMSDLPKVNSDWYVVSLTESHELNPFLTLGASLASSKRKLALGRLLPFSFPRSKTHSYSALPRVSSRSSSYAPPAN